MSTLANLLNEAPLNGTTDEKLAWASKTWQATVAQAKATNAAKAAQPAPWTPRYGHKH